jgi:hypothetical protein
MLSGALAAATAWRFTIRPARPKSDSFKPSGITNACGAINSA